MNIVSFDKTFPANGFIEKPDNYLFILEKDEFAELMTEPYTESVCYLHDTIKSMAAANSDKFGICVHNRIYEGVNFPYIGISYISADSYGARGIECNDGVARIMLMLANFDYVRLDKIGAFN